MTKMLQMLKERLLDFNSLIDYNVEEDYHEKHSKYINRDTALNIALKEKNLRRDIYNEGIDNGINYGLIEIKDLYATLVISKQRFAFYIKVLNATYEVKENNQNKKKYFNKYSQIRCLVYTDNGEYKYLSPNFDTRNIRMVTDDEYLDYINNVK